MSRKRAALSFYGSAAVLRVAAGVCIAASMAGCGRFHRETHDSVWVSVRQIYLHDRVAAVSNHVAEVGNGQRLEVLDRTHRFLKVKTEKNEVGWIEERAVIDAKTHAAFEELATSHEHDDVVARGIARDDVYLHIRPGRESDRFPLLPANDKVELLARASAPKIAAQILHAAPAREPQPAGSATGAGNKSTPPSGAAEGEGVKARAQANAPAAEVPVVMEDWWLVRDAQGRTGWLLSGRIDVDAPDDVAQYAEGQRIVSAFVLAKVTDPASSAPDHAIAEYVTALAPPQAGLPFDFDQIRVFTWSVKRHRYETAFRLHPISGYLPLKVVPADGGKASTFSFQIASGPNVSVDPATGAARPAAPRTIRYEMIDTRVQRVGPDMAPIPVGHVEGEKPKAKNEKGSSKAAKTGKKKRKD